MLNWRNLTADEFTAAVADLRRQGKGWEDIARTLQTSTSTLRRKVRPHLPPELNAPLQQMRHNGTKSLRAQVYEYLDECGDRESRQIAADLDINFSTACTYHAAWLYENGPKPEPEWRCPTCGLPVPEGTEGECDWCKLQREGIVVMYKLIEDGLLTLEGKNV